ncbi:uncharacterized protein LOC117176471 [Belonocnema kinseyi]|uniref:uncharacterized protein LOC117176471 n=1 Tax=Belonocnema kinseyi TaxID=2817044 RepID=UPI00143D51EC|nr:uncharacterized protein LOC117176471 [Belonocnema kinseyi]
MTSSKDSRYSDDTVLQNVNHFVTVTQKNKQTNSAHLNFLMECILPIMKEEDETFKRLYNSIQYGGSFYKGTKISNAEEYDLDLIIKLQETPLKVEMSKNKPGYVKIKLQDPHVDVWKNYHGQSWLAIPKPLNGDEGNLLWRASFYEQEKELLLSKKHLKNVLRLLKKLRNQENFSNLSSYYIETLFFHEIDSQNPYFWEQNSLTYLFMHMLKKLQRALENCEIKSYWAKNSNLLERLSKEEKQNMASRLKKIVNIIEKTIDSDPLAIARFLLNEKEMKKLSTEYDEL